MVSPGLGAGLGGSGGNGGNAAGSATGGDAASGRGGAATMGEGAAESSAVAGRGGTGGARLATHGVDNLVTFVVRKFLATVRCWGKHNSCEE